MQTKRKRTRGKTGRKGGRKVPRPLAPETFNFARVPANVKKSPIKLRDWLDVQLPWLLGPRITSVEAAGGQRGTILTVHGVRFAAKRADNEVKINGTVVPVLATTSDTLKVLATKDVDTGPVTVTVGGRTATSAQPFTVRGYPGDGDDGPPVLSSGAGDGAPGDVNPIGTIRVMVVLCQATDRVPANLAAVRTALTNAWNNVHIFYDQASFTRTNVQVDIAANAAALDGVFTDFLDLSPSVQNIKGAQLGRIAAFAAQQAQNEGFVLNNYQMLCSVMFTNGDFIRAWGGTDTQTFSYDNGKPMGDPARIHIDISLTQKINELWIQETADWGRFAHEFGHNIVSAPTESGDGTATLGEDVYGSDLVDASAATAQDFELMGNHDSHPIFTGLSPREARLLPGRQHPTFTWDRNPHTEEVDIVAHGLSEDIDQSRSHCEDQCPTR